MTRTATRLSRSLDGVRGQGWRGVVLGAVCKSRDLRLTQPPHNLNLSWDRDLISHGDTVDTAWEPSSPSFPELGLQRALTAGPRESTVATGAGRRLCHSLALPGPQEIPRGRPGDLPLPDLHIAPGPGLGVRHRELRILKVCRITSVLRGSPSSSETSSHVPRPHR